MGASRKEIEQVYASRHAGYKLALSAVTHDLEIARDVVQDAFAIALARRRTFRGGSLEAWIWRIAYRRALDARSANGRPVRGMHYDLERPDILNDERDPELTRAITALPPRRRLIVFLRYFADLSYAQIAEACEVSEGTVAAALARAHSDLSVALDPQDVRG
jgi:RNA polymerase sigma factor (sigma-70 family)